MLSEAILRNAFPNTRFKEKSDHGVNAFLFAVISHGARLQTDFGQEEWP